VKLDGRLSSAADFVRGGRLVDVGSDHAILPLYLLKNGVISSAVASDINDGPLETGRKNAVKHNLTEHIEFIKSDGLDNIDLSGVTDISIAGMGGELIAEILMRAGGEVTGINLILQPMTKWEYLFEFLIKNGYQIKKHKTVFCDNQQYDIIKAGIRNNMIATSKTIYNAIDGIAPFALARHYNDNSGLLVGDFSDEKCSRVLITLDISNAALHEAKAKNCDLIISHHPVIYHPLKKLSMNNPAVLAASFGITCICAHINFDASKTGMNSIFVSLFEEFFATGSVYNKRVIEDFGDGHGVGVIFELPRKMSISSRDFALRLKAMFGSGVVKFTDKNNTLEIKKIAFCSGAGGEFLTEIIDKKLADVYITSDCKHSAFIEAGNAENPEFALFDCGHFATEAIMKKYLCDYLQNVFRDCEFIVSENDKEPYSVVEKENKMSLDGA
jgi:dinuclear metal center YbgI/SA1388 family protein